MNHFKGNLISTIINYQKIYDVILLNDGSFITFSESGGTEPYRYSLSVNWCNFNDSKPTKSIELFKNVSDNNIKYFHLKSENIIIVAKDQDYVFSIKSETILYWLNIENQTICNEIVTERLGISAFSLNGFGNKIIRPYNEKIIDKNSITIDTPVKNQLLTSNLKVFNNYKWTKHFYNDIENVLIFIGYLDNSLDLILYEYSTSKVLNSYSKSCFLPENRFPFLKFDALNNTLIIETVTDESTSILFFTFAKNIITHKYGGWFLKDFNHIDNMSVNVIDANISLDKLFFTVEYLLIKNNNEREYSAILLNYVSDEIIFKFSNTKKIIKNFKTITVDVKNNIHLWE